MEASPVIRRKITLSLLVAIMISFLSVCSGCVSMLRIDGPYEGRVIDAETGKPIEGAVAHGTWSRIHPNPAGRSTEYYDSYEVLTDKDGDFKIPGKGLLIFSNIDDMTLTIFKAGYTQFPRHSSWIGLVQFGPFDKVSWDEYGKGTFKLRRMMMEERRKRVIDLPRTPKSKQRLMRNESNKENLEIGEPESTQLPLE